MSQREKLFSEFTAPTTQEWLDKIQVDLKGADFQKKMVWRTNEGFSMQPFYRREDVLKLKTPDSLPGEFPYVRGNKRDNNEWYVRQNIDANHVKVANGKALLVLNRGVNSLGFSFSGDHINERFVALLLHGIYCESVELNFSSCARRSLQLAKLLDAYFTKKRYSKDKIEGSISWDPLERLLSSGKDTTHILPFASRLVEVTQAYPHLRCIAVNSMALVNAGAYIVQELGYALAWGHEYLSLLVDQGVDPALAASKIKFNMGVSENYFMEIAKFRAARLLWAQIVNQYEQSDLEAAKMCVNATTSMYNMTIFDAHVNLLRSQTEAMSACLGGVHSLVVTPYDAVFETPNAFSERIARNQQLLLLEESHFDKVCDPSAGSYFIEQLTCSLAEAAWQIFLKIEDEGGFLEALKKGIVQDDINATNLKRHDDASKRKEFILGTNQFPNFNEKSEGHRPVASAAHSSSCGCIDEAFKHIEATRLAADFERLRFQTEESAHVPVAFMLTIGNLAMRQARAQFSSNFLACAGYKIIDNLGFKTVEEGVDAAMAAGADIVVLCSSDDEYAEYAIPAFRYLNGRAMFIVAGAPACMDDLKAAGIERFIHVRSNVLETLRQYNTELKVCESREKSKTYSSSSEAAAKPI